MKNSFRIAEISYGKSKADCAYEFEYAGRHFEVQRFGSNLSIPYLKDLVIHLRNQVDAFAISDLPAPFNLGGKSYVHHQYLEIMETPSSIPLCDGSRIREISTVNGLNKAIADGVVQPKDGLFFPLGLLNLEVIYNIARQWERHIYLGDLYSLMAIPHLIHPNKMVEKLARVAIHIANMRELKSQTPMALTEYKQNARRILLERVKDIQYVYSDINVIQLFGTDLEFLRNKTLITPWNHPTLEAEILKHEPKAILNLLPEPLRLSPYITYAVLEATIRLAEGRAAPLSLEEWQTVLSKKIELSSATRRFVMGARPMVQSRISGTLAKYRARLSHQKEPDFAFVVHALSNEDIFRVPGIKMLKGLPKGARFGIEKAVGQLPGFHLGEVQKIVSEKTGQETTGTIYALLTTPKIMLSEPPEVLYPRIEALCHDAADSGAKIIGLGAYTKVVGDSGETINRNSPIPVTTGNSLSSAATLWAVEEVVRKMGLLKPLPGSNRYDGIAMVIGATGSIGKVSAKILSQQYRQLIMVAPRLNRLEELATEISAMEPDCKVMVSTNANEYAHLADVVVTATSAFDQKIVDVENLKPGCVVCDCSRPLDFNLEDAMKRPDVLIIESGEVILPGSKVTCDLGLPGNIVYACLAETAVLAMEGMYEPFTLGRNIDWKKVIQIRKLAEEHGVKLAAIRGHTGFISDKEIELTRELALKRRGALRT